MLEKMKLEGSMTIHKTFQDYKQQQQKDVFFIIEDWNAKVGSQEISGVTGKQALE